MIIMLQKTLIDMLARIGGTQKDHAFVINNIKVFAPYFYYKYLGLQFDPYFYYKHLGLLS